MMETMFIPMCYDYKGSPNCYLRLKHDVLEGIIEIKTDYDELIAIVTSGVGLERVLKDLIDGKYV